MRVTPLALASCFVSSFATVSYQLPLKRGLLRWVGTILMLLTVSGSVAQHAGAQAPPYLFETISLPAPYTGGVTAVNTSNQMVGTYSDANGNHGFFYSQGQFTTIDVAGASRTVPVDINDKGLVVGYYHIIVNCPSCVGQSHAFLWSAGQLTLLPDFPGAYRNEPAGINNLGVVVGWWCCVNNDNEAGGFLYRSGSTSQIDYPGTDGPCAVQNGAQCDTYPVAINDAGNVVGIYTIPSDTGSHAFLLSGGQYSNIDPPGQNCANYQTECGAYGISASGTIGISVGGLGLSVGSGFLLSAGKFTPFVYPGSSFTSIQRVNSQGWILGSSNIARQFLALPAVLVDPVPDLMSSNAPATISNPETLAALGFPAGRLVQGVEADGVTEVVVQIPAVNVGDQFTITLFNDQQPPAQSTSALEDGALGNPGDTTFTQSQIAVQAVAVNTPSGQQVPVAFAVYRAPLDFARQNLDSSFKTGMCGTIIKTDDNLACRTVSLQIQNQSQGTTATLPITILRPPVVMVHGLWDSWQEWKNFNPLVSGPNNVDPRFYVGRVSYDQPIGGLITASDPPYTPIPPLVALPVVGAKANSLGFAFNANNVQAQIDGWIGNFKLGKNPVGIAAAAVQADIVAHSMGGDIALTMLLQPRFFSNDTFGQGDIHKLITIDTPYLGSPLASLLLQSEEEGRCVETSLAVAGNFVFNNVQFGGSTLVPGAIGDLSPSSQALSNIGSIKLNPLPTALIAGVYTNFGTLSPDNSLIGAICSTVADPLALDLTPTKWPQLFNPQGNDPNGGNSDAIVSETSQLDGRPPSAGFVATSFLHSDGLPGHVGGLGFVGQSVLDAASAPNPIPNQVIQLLNTRVTDPVFNVLNQ